MSNKPRLKQPFSPQWASEPEVLETNPLSVSLGRAADMLDISKTKFYQLVNDGEIPTFHIHKRHLVSVERLKQWIADQHKNNNVLTAMQKGGVA